MGPHDLCLFFADPTGCTSNNSERLQKKYFVAFVPFMAAKQPKWPSDRFLLLSFAENTPEGCFASGVLYSYRIVTLKSSVAVTFSSLSA